MKFQIFKQKLNFNDYTFLVIATALLALIVLRIYSQYGCNTQTNILILLLFFMLLPLVFLAYKDFKTFEVDHYTSLALLIIFSVLNISLFLLKGNDFQIALTEKWMYIPYQNLLGAIALGLIFQLLVLATKEKGLGQGDVRIAIICGFFLGFSNLIPWLYITIFTALAYGIGIAVKNKNFRGTKVPFVPFMILGIIGTIIYLV